MRILSLFVSVGIFLLSGLLYPSLGYSISTSFLSVAVVLTFMVLLCTNYRSTGINFTSTTVFFLLFFYIAPILQLLESPTRLLNTMPVREEQIVLVNMLSLLFLSVYTITYLALSRISVSSFLVIENSEVRKMFPLLYFVAVIAAFWGLVGIDFSVLDNDKVESDDMQNMMLIVFKHKVLFTIPFLVFSLYLLGARGKIGITTVGVLLLLVLATKNPFYDRRNSLGPVYIALFVIAIPYFIQETRRYFLMIAGIMIVLFPMSSILTHHKPSQWAEVFTGEMLYKEISGHFVDMHYDAWANFVATVDYVGMEGHHYGFQLLGSLLFFVPRSLWTDKPIASGQLLGDYLSQGYSMWFNNISCPFPAEGYIDFGLIGVVFYALGLAWFTRYFDRLVGTGNWLDMISGIYYASFLFFVLRGSLLPAVAYGTGAYIAIKILPLIVAKIRVMLMHSVASLKGAA